MDQIHVAQNRNQRQTHVSMGLWVPELLKNLSS
jgi:hypothetical protein